ncbi:MAG: hypothetical protein IJL63_03150 [Clostridia bacterium]|nr:hypothetical protein [Clostridia bacterium]
MKSYEQMTESVFKRINDYNEGKREAAQRRKKAAGIISVAFVFVAVAAAGTAAYKTLKNKPAEPKKQEISASISAPTNNNVIAEEDAGFEVRTEKPIETTTQATEQQPVQSDFVDPYNEEKIYNTFTIDQDFEGDKVVVEIKKYASVHGKKFTPEDFPGVDIESVDTLEIGKDKPQGEFHLFCVITLNHKGKQEVLDAIAILEQMDFVRSALPHYYYPPDLDD